VEEPATGLSRVCRKPSVYSDNSGSNLCNLVCEGIAGVLKVSLHTKGLTHSPKCLAGCRVHPLRGLSSIVGLLIAKDLDGQVCQ
jgi:hypothetical protein